jgi:hypothetical protein
MFEICICIVLYHVHFIIYEYETLRHVYVNCTFNHHNKKNKIDHFLIWKKYLNVFWKNWKRGKNNGKGGVGFSIEMKSDHLFNEIQLHLLCNIEL